MQQVVYQGGDILTMNGSKPEYVDCIVTEGAEIVYVGSRGEVEPFLKPGFKTEDLDGRCLMPGFIDPHIHPSMAAVILNMHFITPFDWRLPGRQVTGIRGEEEYKETLRQWIGEESGDGWLKTWGFHHYFHGALTRKVLDELCPNRPLLVWHRSFHEIFLNSAALDNLDFEDVEVVRAHHQVDWENGHFYERGMEALIAGSTVFLEFLPGLEAGYQACARAVEAGGITTIADMEFPMMDQGIEEGMCNQVLKNANTHFSTFCVPSSRFFLKSTGSHTDAIKAIKEKATELNNSQLHMFTDHVKVIGDGAFFSQLMQMKDGYTDGHSGEWFTSPEDMEVTMRAYWAEGSQIHVHTNGDLAMQVVLDIVEKLGGETPRKGHRTTIEHAGFFTQAQATRLADLGCLVSANPWYHHVLADKYTKVGLGEERATQMCPLGLLVDANVPLALHSDFTMAPARPLSLVWAAVNRVTAESKSVNHPELRVPAYKALQGVTSVAAEVLGLADRIGSLRVGKEANLVLLERNPLVVKPIEIQDIKVLGTVFRGKVNRLE